MTASLPVRRRAPPNRRGSSGTMSTSCCTSSHPRPASTTGSRISGTTSRTRRPKRPRPNRTCLLIRQQFVRGDGYRESMLTTNQKGTLAEAKLLAAAMENGVGVAHPFDDERYDLILDLRPHLVRVQCKWARRIGDVISVRLYTSRRGPDGMINRPYSLGEFDAFGVYSPDTASCYLLPASEFVAQRQVYLRLSPTQNNQNTGVRWARD